MSEDTITYEFIREIHRQEQRDPKLSRLPDDFLDKVNTYIEQKEKLLGTKKDKQISQEIDNAKRLLESIFNRRETKIINHAILTSRTDIPIENLTKEEEELFYSMVDQLKERRGKALNLLFKRSKEEEKPENNLDLEEIEFTEDIPEFAGIDSKNYGPYKKGEKAKIPKENAELFKKLGKAR